MSPRFYEDNIDEEEDIADDFDDDGHCCPECDSPEIVGMFMPGVIECDDCGFKGYVKMSRWKYARRFFS